VRHWRVILLDRSLFPATRIVAPVVATSLVPALAATTGILAFSR
jgi:alcohol dehydrogenase class IV